MSYISNKLLYVIFKNNKLKNFKDINKITKKVLRLKKKFSENEFIKFKDIIDYIIGFNLNINKFVKYKDKSDNGVELLLNYYCDKYNTNDENKRLVDELDYKSKKQVLDNLLKLEKGIYIDINKINSGIYNSSFNINKLNLEDDLMFMRVLGIDKVNGDFNCSNNNNLRSLRGGPKIVEKRYDCSDCNLISLEGCAEEVGSFYCYNNKNLKSLKGGPKIVGGYYECSRCGLESLEGCAEEVSGFNCCNNRNLESLKYGPNIVEGKYSCFDCGLISLIGSPEKVSSFDCSFNENLKDLIGGPKVVKIEFKCSYCNLETLDGLAKEIGLSLSCLGGNKFDREYVERYIKDNGVELRGDIK